MENVPYSQLYEFAASVLWGGALGVLYGLFGFFRLKGNKWITAVSDFAFWLIAAFSSFVFLLAVNGGSPRGYMLLGAAGGGILVGMYSGNLLNRLKLSVQKRRLNKRRGVKPVKIQEKEL
jgi:peptidoglycan/LPS O-acetylase OafA/YrhL